MTDPQNTQNQGSGGVSPAGPVNTGNVSTPGPLNDGNSFTADNAVVPDKPKKRRRRRRKKPAMKTGQDVPLVLSEKALPDAVPASLEQPIEQPIKESGDFLEAEPETIHPEFGYSPEPPFVPAPLPPSEQTPPQLEESQLIFEEKHPDEAMMGAYIEPSAGEPVDTGTVSVNVETETVDDGMKVPVEKPEEVPEEEQADKQASLDQAKKISENLLNDQADGLEELPQRQGLFGKIFNLLERVVHGKEQIQQQMSEIKVEVVQPDGGDSRQGAGVVLGLIKFLFKLAIIAALIAAAFWAGSSFKIMDRINGLLMPKQGLELVKGDNTRIVVDQELFERWGFRTAVYFGKNHGDIRDLTYNIFFNANYFGLLKDPVFFGQTGISAAIYYGFGRDVVYIKNRYIYYVQYLAKLRFANAVKVSDVLDGKVRRDEALDAFVNETRDLFEEGNKLRKEINVQVDDLKISVNSLDPDKDRYETDFFAALEQTQGEKSEVLINKFIDTAQKQVELKAKLAALTKLSILYEEALIQMKIKLDDVVQNREALITGVTVKEVPGSDLNLIRK